MASAPRSLNGKVVAITGGGRGLGRAIAVALAAEGARVAIGDLDRAAAERVAADLGGHALALELDVTDHDRFSAFLDAVEARLGPLDVLINNAGIMVVTPLPEESPASVARQLELNLHAVIHGTQEAMRRMVPRGTGHIVNMSSLAGRSGFAMLGTYAATKHGVVGLSEAARAELRGSGVEVSVVMPYFARTELAAGVPDVRVLPRLAPDAVAAEVVAALKRPRFDVYVPRWIGPLFKVGQALPRRVRDAIEHAFRAHEALLDTDRAARSVYEARAAASAPAGRGERTGKAA